MDMIFIGSLVVIGWFIPLIIIGFCYGKVIFYLSTMKYFKTTRRTSSSLNPVNVVIVTEISSILYEICTTSRHQQSVISP